MDAQKKKLNRWVVPAFVLLCLAQLYLPLKMITSQEAVVSTGKAFRFKVAPLDPNDPFRGKYITLRYQANSVKVKDVNQWKRNTRIYVSLKTDSQGYAAIRNISARRPHNRSDYVEAKVAVLNGQGGDTLYVDYPFGRFYMEEAKAVKAEKMFLETWRSPQSDAYAKVYVKDGNAVIDDVLVNGRSVKDIH